MAEKVGSATNLGAGGFGVVVDGLRYLHSAGVKGVGLVSVGSCHGTNSKALKDRSLRGLGVVDGGGSTE